MPFPSEETTPPVTKIYRVMNLTVLLSIDLRAQGANA